MENLLLYLLKSGGCLLLFFVCFKALFSNDTFFRINRMMLIGGSAACMVLPLIQLPIPEATRLQQPMIRLEQLLTDDREAAPGVLETTALPPGQTEASIEEAPPSPKKSGGMQPSFSWGAAWGALYGVGCLVCLLTIAVSFHRMLRLIRSGRRLKREGYKLILIPSPIVPFSWGRYIVLSEEDYETNPQEIVSHERAHLRLGHFYDLIFMEFITLVQWFNPAAWLLKRELHDIHEYQADLHVLQQGIDATQYQLLLVKKAVGSSLYTLANSFNHSKIKKRITMMLKKKSNVKARLKLALLLPLGLLALCMFSRSEPVTASEASESQITPDKGTNSVQRTTKGHTIYISYNYVTDDGKHRAHRAIRSAVDEDQTLKDLDSCIVHKRFFNTQMITIEPSDLTVSKSFLNKVKTKLEAAGYPCTLEPAKKNRQQPAEANRTKEKNPTYGVSISTLISSNKADTTVSKKVECKGVYHTEEEGLAWVKKTLADGTLNDATQVMITPFDGSVPKEYLQKIKRLVEANGMNATIKKSPEQNVNRQAPPPPPPPAPDLSIRMKYKDGTGSGHFLVYQRHLTNKEPEQWIAKTDRGDVDSVLIQSFRTPDGPLLAHINHLLIERFGNKVAYKVEK